MEAFFSTSFSTDLLKSQVLPPAKKSRNESKHRGNQEIKLLAC
jgi:hypothetical protein